MFAEVQLAADEPQMRLQVASAAVIRTGVRNLVLVAGADGRYLPTEVRLGAEAHGRTVVLEGLEAGQKVVVSGQFLIDSEASLEGVLERLQADAPPQADAAPSHDITGKVVSLSSDGITIAHEAIPALGWPAMTMDFRLARPELAAQLRPGDTIGFRFRQAGDDYVIEELRRSGGAR